MSVSLIDKLTLPQLVRFSLPTVVSMIFLSVYTIVDGIFVARFVGSDALSGLNIAYPCYGLLMAFATMFGTGGSAYVSYRMGQGKKNTARRSFTFIFCVLAGISVSVAAGTAFYIEEICVLLGADKALLPYAVDYLRVLMLYNPLGVLQTFFLCFFSAANKPKLALWLSLAGGFLNIALDYLFIVEYGWGIKGAAYATMLGCFVPAAGGLVFFFCNRELLYFMRPVASRSALLHSMTNGSSEMVSTVSVSVCCILINLAMMKYVGSAGVAAYSAALYCDFLIVSGFFGFSIGIAPHVSFHYGAKHQEYLRQTVRKCLMFLAVMSVVFFGIFCFLTIPIAEFFFGRERHVFDVAAAGLRIFAFSFLFKGMNVFGSALFTALGNGKISAVLAFSRTFLFIVFNVYVLSYFWGVTGVWLAIPFAEAMALFVFAFYCKVLKQEYHVL